MSRSSQTSRQYAPQPAKAGAGFLIAALLGGGLLFAGLAGYMHYQQRKITADTRAAARLNSALPQRPVAQVASAIAAMKLVTVEIDTKVRIERGEKSWRGDVRAMVEYPVRLSYGVDLSSLTSLHVGFSTLRSKSGAYIVSIPPPQRIATQIMSERVPPELAVGWLRLRSMAGEYYISQARKDAPRAAADLELLPDDARRIEELSIAQVAKMVKSIVGEDTEVIVKLRSLPSIDGGST